MVSLNINNICCDIKMFIKSFRQKHPYFMMCPQLKCSLYKKCLSHHSVSSCWSNIHTWYHEIIHEKKLRSSYISGTGVNHSGKTDSSTQKLQLLSLMRLGFGSYISAEPDFIFLWWAEFSHLWSDRSSQFAGLSSVHRHQQWLKAGCRHKTFLVLAHIFHKPQTGLLLLL